MDPTKKIIPFLSFALFASPQAFQLVRSLLGSWVASSDGLPTMAGLLLHALVFIIVTHFVWRAVYGPKTPGSCGCGN
jgi:hypothetical protein